LFGLFALASALLGSSASGGPAPTAGLPDNSSTPKKPAMEGPFARPDELTDAKGGGQRAFEALLEKYPRDPNIPVEMARDMAAQKNWPGAVGAVGRAL